MPDNEIPEDLFAGDASLDFTGMYLNASNQTPVESRIKGKTSVRELVSQTQSEGIVAYPPVTGTRVAFSSSIEAMMAYHNPPDGGGLGTIVTVRTASGDVNHHAGKVFVRWDGGRMMPIYATHLRAASGRQRTADAVSRRVASLGDLGDFLKMSKDTLIHKATRDLWAFKKVGEDYVVERLFDESGDPLKE